jgi:hypothetical protein
MKVDLKLILYDESLSKYLPDSPRSRQTLLWSFSGLSISTAKDIYFCLEINAITLNSD